MPQITDFAQEEAAKSNSWHVHGMSRLPTHEMVIHSPHGGPSGMQHALELMGFLQANGVLSARLALEDRFAYKTEIIDTPDALQTSRPYLSAQATLENGEGLGSKDPTTYLRVHLIADAQQLEANPEAMRTAEASNVLYTATRLSEVALERTFEAYPAPEADTGVIREYRDRSGNIGPSRD